MLAPAWLRSYASKLPDAQANIAASLLSCADDLQEVIELLRAHSRSSELIRGIREFPLSKDDRHFILNAIADRLRLLEQIPAYPLPNLEQHELQLAQEAEFARLQILHDFFYDSSYSAPSSPEGLHSFDDYLFLILKDSYGADAANDIWRKALQRKLADDLNPT